MPVPLCQSVLPSAFIGALDEILKENAARCHRMEYTSTGRRKKTVSRKTMKDREAGIRLAFAELWQLGYRLQHPTHLKEKHCDALVLHWVQAGHSAAYIQTRASALRVFGEWIGKARLVRPTAVICPDGQASRQQAAKHDLSWKGKGLDARDVIAQALSLDVRFAVMLSLQAEFGLRVKESIEMHPARVMNSDGTFITVWEGTKGGRQRVVPVTTDAQRAALANAIQVASQHPTGRVRWPDMTWRQAQGRFYRLMAKLGLQRSEAGVTAHGLRHEFAQKQYRARTGKPTPIEGGRPGEIDRAAHQAAAQDVSQLLGHNRISVTTAYYGSYGHQLRAPLRYTFSFQAGDLSP